MTTCGGDPQQVCRSVARGANGGTPSAAKKVRTVTSSPHRTRSAIVPPQLRTASSRCGDKNRWRIRHHTLGRKANRREDPTSVRYFLGVDGGNSKTLAVVADETGRVLGVGRAGGSNHQGIGLS